VTSRPDDDPLLRETTTGLVRGVRERGVLAWRGIPYAAPPTGARRFRAPVPAASWRGVRDASRFGPARRRRGREP
jgi:para-nitrobenzyl esterase